MSIKNDLKQEIYDEMSEALAGFISSGEGEEAGPVTFGPFRGDIDYPTTVDDAIIVMGQVNHDFHKGIMTKLDGFPFGEAMLKMAMLSPTLRGILLSSLEIAAAVSNSRIQMIMPENGATYYGAVTEIRCSSPGAIGMAASTTTGSVDLELDETSGEWSALWPFAIGQHQFTIVARYESEEEVEETVNFSVSLWETFPASGGTYTPGEIDRLEIATGDDTERVTDASMSIAGQTYTLVKETAAWAWREAVDLVAGETQAILNLTIDGETIEDIIYFTVNET